MLTFDTTGWQPVDNGVWNDGRGVLLFLQGFDLPPNIPAPLESGDLFQQQALFSAGQGATLIDLDVPRVDGVPAMRMVTKEPHPRQQSGIGCLGAVIVPRANCSVKLSLMALEEGTTGQRDSMAFMRHFQERSALRMPVDQVRAEFYTNPLGPRADGKIPWNRSDLAEWDDLFPDHPLTRVRRWLHHLTPTVRLHPDFLAQPPFTGPGRQPAGTPGRQAAGTPGRQAGAPSGRRWWQRDRG